MQTTFLSRDRLLTCTWYHQTWPS